MLRAQFTYTKSGRPGVWEREPGWKVQSLSGVPGAAPVPAEVIRSAARNVGGFVPPPLPELPSQADVDALPRCLRLDVLDPTLTCLSHVVAAGPDYSGRPNFFAHGLVLDLGEDEADERGLLRPADLWDADLWLRPLGPKAVESSEPDDTLQRLHRGPLDDAALEAFTRSHPNQRSMVLAAFERFAGGGGPLVVVGEAAQSIAMWHRLIGLLLTPATAWRTPFSTYERAHDTLGPVGWPFALVGVPAADGDVVLRLPGQRFAVLHDDREAISAGLGRWRLHDGSELTAGPWAQLAETVVVAGLLPDVAMQVDALSIECGVSTATEPLWALGAAVLLLDDLPLDDLARDAAELVARHWPAGLVAGRRTVEELLGRLSRHAASPERGTAQVLERSGGQPDGLVTQLALLTPVRAALASPVAFEESERALPTTLPRLAPAVRQELDDLVADALGWVPVAGATAVRALLRIAGLMDARDSPAGDRAVAGDLARSLLVPRLLDEDTDPESLRWPPCPSWLWQELVPAVTEVLDIGRHLPGEAFSAATHAWLGELSLPRGPLTAEVLAQTGPIEWERAAYRVWRDRGASPTPAERAAAFLAMVNSSAVTEGRPEDRWAQMAAEEAYPRGSLDLATAVVLMAVLPRHLAFAPVLAVVLDRTPPGPGTVAALNRLVERGEAVTDTAYDGFFEPHLQWVERRGDEDGSLVRDRSELVPLIRAALEPGAPPSARHELTAAILRVDVGALPLEGLASRGPDPAMPWEEGWALLRERVSGPAARTVLAAHLISRGARAGVFPDDDHARPWLTGPAGRGQLRVESAALELLSDAADLDAVVREVERLADEAPRKPPGAGPRTAEQESYWRQDAVVMARRLAANASRGDRSRGRLRSSLRGLGQGSQAE